PLFHVCHNGDFRRYSVKTEFQIGPGCETSTSRLPHCIVGVLGFRRPPVKIHLLLQRPPLQYPGSAPFWIRASRSCASCAAFCLASSTTLDLRLVLGPASYVKFRFIVCSCCCCSCCGL